MSTTASYHASPSGDSDDDSLLPSEDRLPSPRVSFSLDSPRQETVENGTSDDNEVFPFLSTTDDALAGDGFRRKRVLTDTSIRSAPTPTLLRSGSQETPEKRGAKKVKKYYRKQSLLMESYNTDQRSLADFVQAQRQGSESAVPSAVDDAGVLDEKEWEIVDTEEDEKRVTLLSRVTLAVNAFLLTIKLIAAGLSGSFAIISSVIDSAVDITGGLVILLTTRAIKRRDPYLYPRGRTRLEPIALIIISVVMAVASIQMVIQSVEATVRGNVHPEVGFVTIGIMVLTIVIKSILFFFCWKRRSSPSIRILAQDHRNDCISNSVAVICAFLADRFWSYLDPIGAILVSVYIAGTWFWTGYAQIVILSGRSAKPAYINRIIKVALEHDDRVQSIDTVYAYHFGTKFLVEVHIVLPEEMTLREAHDISEPLQQKLESLPYVERAFVHADYESCHRPEDEHKVV